MGTIIFTDQDIFDNRNKIVSRLKEIREEKGFSQEQIADLMKVSRTTVSKIESGKFNCSLDYLSKFSFVLGFKIDLVCE